MFSLTNPLHRSSGPIFWLSLANWLSHANWLSLAGRRTSSRLCCCSLVIIVGVLARAAIDGAIQIWHSYIKKYNCTHNVKRFCLTISSLCYVFFCFCSQFSASSPPILSAALAFAFTWLLAYMCGIDNVVLTLSLLMSLSPGPRIELIS